MTIGRRYFALRNVLLLGASVVGAFSPTELFAAGEQGVWYDPSDFSTMFQDAAGTTPVTAVEQYVGKILDKSGRGNHATQSTETSRPLLSARVNLLTSTEDFSHAAWVKSTCTASAMNVADPIGGNTASTITATLGVAYFYYDAGTSSPANGIVTTATIWARRRTGTGVVGLRNNAATGTYDTLTLTSSWQLYSVSCTAGATNQNRFVINIQTTGDAIDIWHPDLRVSNSGVGLPAYQRVTSATDYDTSGFPLYLRFDGTDDSLATASINFSVTDKMTVFAGVRKLSDATLQVVFEMPAAGAPSLDGSMALYAPNFTPNNYEWGARGTIWKTATSGTSYASPITNLITGTADIAGDNVKLRINGSQVAQTTTDLGTGNLGNYPLYIGRRGGSSFPYNGNLYSLIVRGSSSTAAQIASTEAWLNAKTKAYAA